MNYELAKVGEVGGVRSPHSGDISERGVLKVRSQKAHAAFHLKDAWAK